MQHISEEKFISAIESIRSQIAKDKLSSDLIEQVFPGSEISMYDNSSVIKAVISLLRVWFPVDSDGFCELEHYCFDLDFGKHAEGGYLSSYEFYKKLKSKHNGG
jgi:hypothetical protein